MINGKEWQSHYYEHVCILNEKLFALVQYDTIYRHNYYNDDADPKRKC